MQEFYSNIFNIEITVFGIISAAVFVFLQILYSHFSYNNLISYIKRPLIAIYAITISLSVVITSASFFLLSIGNHNFIQKINFYSLDIIHNEYCSLSVLALFLFSIGLGIFIIFDSIHHLKPSNLLLLIRRQIKPDLFKKFLLKKYGVKEPREFIFQTIIFDDAFDNKNTKNNKKVLKIPDISDEERAEYKKEFENARIEYVKLKAEIENTPEIFEGLTTIITQSIRNSDLVTIKSGVNEVNLIAQDFIKNFHSDKESKVWNPDSEIPSDLAKYISELSKQFIEICRMNGFVSAVPLFIKMGRDVSLSFIENGYSSAIFDIFKVWQSEADIAIDSREKIVFNEVIYSYKEVADKLFEIIKEDNEKQEKSPINEIFRLLGWLAERLLTKRDFEDKPTMYDAQYQNESDALLNTIFNYSYKINYDLPKINPSIFFDAVIVVYEKLLSIYSSALENNSEAKERIRYEVKNSIFSCLYAFSSFAEDAIKVGNIDGVALSSMKLKNAFEKADKQGAEEIAKDAIEEITRTLITIVSYKENTTTKSRVGDPIEILERILISYSYKYQHQIRHQVFEGYIKNHHWKHDEKWNYIKSLGVKLQNNFGLMFDELTGLDYTTNDPRRK